MSKFRFICFFFGIFTQQQKDKSILKAFQKQNVKNSLNKVEKQKYERVREKGNFRNFLIKKKITLYGNCTC